MTRVSRIDSNLNLSLDIRAASDPRVGRKPAVLAARQAEHLEAVSSVAYNLVGSRIYGDNGETWKIHPLLAGGRKN